MHQVESDAVPATKLYPFLASEKILLVSLLSDCAIHRFLHDIAFGLSIVARGLRTNTDLLDEDGSAQPSPEPAPKKAEEASGSKQSMQLLLHVSNLSVLLPASSK